MYTVPNSHYTHLFTAQQTMTTHSMSKTNITTLTEQVSDFLKSCSSLKSVSETQKIHARIIAFGLHSSLFFQNHILNTYFNCNLVEDAHNVFRQIPYPNTISFNVMITGLSHNGLLGDAHKMFDSMRVRDSASWNALMSGYHKNGMSENVIDLFHLMASNVDCKPDLYSFNCVMKACGVMQNVRHSKEIHGHLLKLDIGSDTKAISTLIDMYIKCGMIDLAVRVFERLEKTNLYIMNSMILAYANVYSVDRAHELFKMMSEKNTVSWNTMISIFSQHGRIKETLLMVVDMFVRGYMLNSTTYSSVISTVASVQDLYLGKHIHAHAIKHQWHNDIFVGSALVDMYAKCGDLKAAKRIFDYIPHPTIASWTALLGGYSQNGLVEEAFELFNNLRKLSVVFDQFTLATMLSACYNLSDVSLGSQLHCLAFKSGYTSSVPVSNALLSVYSKCGSVLIAESIFNSMPSRDIISSTSMITAYSQLGDVHKARDFFDKMSTRNVITWNAMLATYIQHEHEEEGLKLYVEMMIENRVKADWVTFVTLVSACANIGTLKLGCQLIAQSVKTGHLSNSSLANGLIIMYSKCGRILESRRVFDTIHDKDLVSWNSMVTAYAQHGQGQEAVDIFESMLQNGIKPDYISYIAIISGCSHSGLVKEGKYYFASMKNYNVTPTMEHFACMVDLLGRSGFLEEAKDFILEMPVKPNTVVWGALLGACKLHRNTKMAEYAAKSILELDSNDPGSYVSLAKVYADEGDLNNYALFRKLIKVKGVKKKPGCSWMEVNNITHVFAADDAKHPQICDVLKVLDEVMKKIEGLGYVRDESQSIHSELLAVAFGIMNLPSWMTIDILKNLRICRQCHEAIKLISLVENRELVIRDAIRFHHFKEGSCSCKDFW